MRTHIYNKMTTAEIEGYLAGGGDTIFLAVGVVECHGALPVDCETIIPEAFATLLAEKCNGLAMINLPYFYPGGTVSSNATVHFSIADGIDYLTKICKSLVGQGFKRIYLVSGHGPASLTINAFCRDFFEKTLVHPCHLNVIYMMQMATESKDLFGSFETLGKVTYGSYKVMKQVDFIPVDPDAVEPEAKRKETEPEMANFMKLYSPFGGITSQVYSDPDEHGGGKHFRTEEERLAACTEGEAVLKQLIEKIDICALNDALETYQAYVQRVADARPRLRSL